MDIRDMSNKEIAKFFKELADYLEIKGDNPFRIRAYRNAARTIETSGYNFSKLVHEGYDLAKLPDIGDRIAKKIVEIVNTGKLKKLEEIKKEFPPKILDLLKIEGLGPKRVKVLYEELGVGSLEELKSAAQAHKIRELTGFGEKIEQRVLKGVILYKKEGRRFLFAQIEPYAQDLYNYLKGFHAISRLTIAGSFRRRKESIGDLDIVASSNDPLEAIEYFSSYPKVDEIILKGDTRSTIILENSLQVDFRCVSDSSFAATLHYFTGSKAHNIALRKMAASKGWKINEYGVFNEEMKRIAGKSEEEIYRLFGMDYIEPELREDRGEIKAALEGKLPNLVSAKEIRGDLHLRSSFSGAKAKPEELIKEALRLGYKYICIADKASYLFCKHGRSCAPISRYLDTLEELQKRYPQVRIYKGIEVEILADGKLAYDGDDLEAFDIVIAAVDEGFGLSMKSQTKRILKAIANPRVNILAHPTCRIIAQQNACSLDFDQIVQSAAKEGVWLEIDSRPDRLDLDDAKILAARDKGVRFALGSLATRTNEMDQIRYGLYQARRGWLEAKDLINTLEDSKIDKILKSKRASSPK